MSQHVTNRYERIHALLQQHFKPELIDLVDESYKHQVPQGSESHFKLTLVSIKFTGQSRIERHRLISTVVNPERQAGLHALSLALYTPEEWAAQPKPLNSPPCHHKE